MKKILLILTILSCLLPGHLCLALDWDSIECKKNVNGNGKFLLECLVWCDHDGGYQAARYGQRDSTNDFYWFWKPSTKGEFSRKKCAHHPDSWKDQWRRSRCKASWELYTINTAYTGTYRCWNPYLSSSGSDLEKWTVQEKKKIYSDEILKNPDIAKKTDKYKKAGQSLKELLDSKVQQEKKWNEFIKFNEIFASEFILLVNEYKKTKETLDQSLQKTTFSIHSLKVEIKTALEHPSFFDTNSKIRQKLLTDACNSGLNKQLFEELRSVTVKLTHKIDYFLEQVETLPYSEEYDSSWKELNRSKEALETFASDLTRLFNPSIERLVYERHPVCFQAEKLPLFLHLHRVRNINRKDLELITSSLSEIDQTLRHTQKEQVLISLLHRLETYFDGANRSIEKHWHTGSYQKLVTYSQNLSHDTELFLQNLTRGIELTPDEQLVIHSKKEQLLSATTEKVNRLTVPENNVMQIKSRSRNLWVRFRNKWKLLASESPERMQQFETSVSHFMMETLSMSPGRPYLMSPGTTQDDLLQISQKLSDCESALDSFN